MKFVLGVVAGFILAGAAFVAGQPHCPTEDSCAPAYHKTWYGGTWQGEEVTP